MPSFLLNHAIYQKNNHTVVKKRDIRKELLKQDFSPSVLRFMVLHMFEFSASMSRGSPSFSRFFHPIVFNHSGGQMRAIT